MNPLRALLALNRLPLWNRKVRVWDYELRAISFDRLVNLWLHRFGVMGGEIRARLGRFIKPGMRVVDIGANQGLYTLLMSRLVGGNGHVYAFEPDPDLFRAAQSNCRENRLFNVTLFSLALGSGKHSLSLHRSLINAGDNRLAPGGPSWTRQPVDVEVMPLDDVLDGVELDFVKIDVQGWEWEIFRGMSRLLEQNRPLTVYFEFWPDGLRAAGADPRDVLEFLRGKGFTLYSEDTTSPGPITDFTSFVERYRGLKYTDIAAIR